MRGFIRFVVFYFMYFCTNTWAANFEMVLFFANMTNFSISWVFDSGMWTTAKFTLFYKVSWVLAGSVMTTLIQFLFKNLINVGSRLRSYNFSGCLRVSSAAWPALIALDGVRSHSRRSLSRRELSLVPHTIISLSRESWRLSNPHSEPFPWVAVFRKFVEYRS